MNYTKEEFEKMLNHIAEDYVLVRSKYELYCRLTEYSDNHIELLNEISPGFFTLVFNSMISDIFINLAKLVDPKDEVLGTIYKLILDSYNLRNYFPCENKISDQIKKKHQSELRRLGNILSKVQFVRNKRFAHIGTGYHLDRDKIIKEKNITFNDLKKVFEVLHNVLNYYFKAYFGEDLKPFADNATDVDNLMELMALYQDREMNVYLLASGLKASMNGKISLDDI